MKTKFTIAICLACPVIYLIAANIAVMQQFTVTSTTTGTPVQLTNASIQATAVTLYGTKAPQTANSGDVYVSYGQSADGIQAVKITSGQFVTLALQDGRAFFSLSNIWLDVGTSGDGLTVIYDQTK